MEFWNKQINNLEKALLGKAPALLLHYLRTASPVAITELAGEALPVSENVRSAVIASLIARLNSGLQGKTTSREALETLMQSMPHDQRILTIEDVPELHLSTAS